MKYLVGIDIGTTSLKAAVFDEKANMLKSVTRDYTLDVKGDFVEFEATEYWNMTLSAINEIRKEYDIYALSIDTQCETLIITDNLANPVCPAIVWLDNRAVEQAKKIQQHFGEKEVYNVTGQPEINATWPASKLLWLKEHNSDVFEKAQKIFLLEDYLLYKLTGQFVTQETLQSSTIYYDIKNHVWWKDMLDFIGLDVCKLPKVCKSGELIGEYEGIKIVTGAMDQVAGAIGAGVVKKGIVSEMTGTTMAVFAISDEIPEYTPLNKVPCHLNYDGKYCLLMWSPTAGIALKWFKNNFCENYGFKELDELAEKIPAGCDGLTFLPYLCGSVMPKYNPQARGVFYGLSMEHTRGHAVRSILEAVACMLKSNLDYLGVECSEVRSMGGGSHSPLWCRIKADMTGKTLVTLKNDETACLGSAILAGVATGVFESVEAACNIAVNINNVYTPTGVDYTDCYERYCKVDDKIY